MKKFKISLILLTFLFLGGTAFGQMDIKRSVSGAINPGGTGLLFCTYSGGSCTFTAANYIVLSAQTTSGAISAGMAAGNYYITNRGAGADVTLTAPQCGSNSYAVEFSVTDAHYLRVSAYSGDAFRYGATTGAANGYVRSNTIGTHWKATCNGNSYWDIHDLIGVLSYDQ